MTLLHIHTQLLESLDWDEGALDEALHTMFELGVNIQNQEGRINVYELKKMLLEQYSEETCDCLIQFCKSAEIMEKELIEDIGEVDG